MGADIRRVFNHVKRLLGEVESGVIEPASRGEKWFLFFVACGRLFVDNRLLARASALAYTTLLALVPLLAVGVAVSTGLLKDEGERYIARLIDFLVETVAPQLDLAATGQGTANRRAELVARINEFLSNIKSGTLGATGMAGLVGIAIMLLTTIESTFNDIWGVKRGRNWVARVVNYWAFVTLGPVAVFLMIGLASGSQFESVRRFLFGLPVAGPLVGWLVLAVLPLTIPPLLFAVFYKVMPNTRVNWSSALVGGAVGGLLWQLNNLFNVTYVSKVTTYSKIYGSIAALPVFLVGMYFSWAILLLGAQVGYVFQNRELFIEHRGADRVNQRNREFVGLRLMTLIGARFSQGAAPSHAELSRTLEVPSRLVGNLLRRLVDAGLVREVAGPEAAYAPSRPPAHITMWDVLSAFRSGHGTELPTGQDAMCGKVRAEHERIEGAANAAARGVTLDELIHRGDVPA